MRTVFALTIAAAMALTLNGCSEAGKRAQSEAFRSDVTGGEVQWVYWPGKKGSVALWLVPVESQEPLISITCVKGDRKLNVRGHMFQGYQGNNGPVVSMTVEGAGVNLRSRNSWAPTGDTPIARGDMRVTAADLRALAASGKITIGVDTERYTFNGFGAAGHAFPAACAKSLGVS